MPAPAAATYQVTTKRYAPHRFMPTHRHECDKVSLMISGSVSEMHHGSEANIVAGWTVVKPADVSHEDRVGHNGLYTLTIRATGAVTTSEGWSALIADYRCLPFGRSVGGLVRLVVSGVEPPQVLVEEIIFALAAQATHSHHRNDDWYSLAIEVLQDQYDSPPSLTDLAQEVGVHPVTLSRGFTSRGTSKSEIIHGIRVRRALQMLGNSKSIAFVAADLGYADAAHFTRSFRHWIGLTPSEFKSAFSQTG